MEHLLDGNFRTSKMKKKSKCFPRFVFVQRFLPAQHIIELFILWLLFSYLTHIPQGKIILYKES